MARKSSLKSLPEPILAAVNDAIKRGEKIDDIVDLIVAMGEERSRSAVGRYSKSFAELAAQQRDLRAVAETFGKEFGDADDKQGRLLVQLMTSVVTRAVMPIAASDEIEIDGLELSRLAKAVKDATSASKIDVDREAKLREEAAKTAKRQAAADAVTEGRAAGASEETLERIRKKILGI